MDLLLASYLFFIGLMFGSFATVLTTRIPKDESVLSPPSYCDTCLKPIKYRYLFPVLGYLLQSGKSKCCHSPISPINVLIELGTALLFVIAYGSSDSWWEFISLAILATASLPLFYIDFTIMRLPNKLTYSASALGLLLIGAFGISNRNFEIIMQLILRILIITVIFVFLYLVSRGGMGLGDFKLAIVLGILMVFRPWQQLASSFIFAFIAAGIAIVWLLIKGKATRKSHTPFGPYILIGAWISIATGPEFANNVIGLWTIN